MQFLRLATDAMGTRFEIVLGGADPDGLRPVAESAIEEIQFWHDRLSLFDAGSFISHINARAGQQMVEFDDEMGDLFDDCLQVYRDSGGAFDISVAPLMREWGFHGQEDEPPASGPTRPVVSAGIALNRGHRTIRFTRPGIEIDLGGIGKGHAIDCAAGILRESGVCTALLHGGTSTVHAIGAPPGEQGWRVGIAGVPVVAILRDSSLSVSASHGREIEVNSRRIGHVLDPRTGEPADQAFLSAVVGPSARLADAWSTAMLVTADRPEAMPADYASVVATTRTDGLELHVHDPTGTIFDVGESAAAAVAEEF